MHNTVQLLYEQKTNMTSKREELPISIVRSSLCNWFTENNKNQTQALSWTFKIRIYSKRMLIKLSPRVRHPYMGIWLLFFSSSSSYISIRNFDFFFFFPYKRKINNDVDFKMEQNFSILHSDKKTPRQPLTKRRKTIGAVRFFFFSIVKKVVSSRKK